MACPDQNVFHLHPDGLILQLLVRQAMTVANRSFANAERIIMPTGSQEARSNAQLANRHMVASSLLLFCLDADRWLRVGAARSQPTSQRRDAIPWEGEGVKGPIGY